MSNPGSLNYASAAILQAIAAAADLQMLLTEREREYTHHLRSELHQQVWKGSNNIWTVEGLSSIALLD